MLINRFACHWIVAIFRTKMKTSGTNRNVMKYKRENLDSVGVHCENAEENEWAERKKPLVEIMDHTRFPPYGKSRLTASEEKGD